MIFEWVKAWGTLVRRVPRRGKDSVNSMGDILYSSRDRPDRGSPTIDKRNDPRRIQ